MKNNLKKFRVFMFVYWAMMLSVSGMYTMYITQLGFSKKEISIAVTLLTLSSLIGQCVIGYLVDKLGHIKRILFSSISVGILVALGLIFFKLNWQIYILISIWGFFLYGTVPLSETWCIENLKASNEQRNFGKIRGFGSIGYGFSGVLIGLLLQYFGWKIYYWYILIGVCSTLLVINGMSEKKDSAINNDTKNIPVTTNISYKEALNEILKIKPIMSMVVIVFIYSFVVKGIYSYLGVLVSDYGGGPLSLGFTYFFDATPEIFTFFLATKLLKRFHSKKLIAVAFLLQIIRLSLILIFNSAIAVILLGTISGFAYGLLATSYKTYIYELAPAKYKASCMSLCESMIGLAAVISAPIFGFIFTKYGTKAAISVGLIIYIISAFVILITSYKDKELQQSK